ncbi:unnamed protein product [Moneuplotes crassus]|uniref:Glutaredoxin domain-containing protein n=1 Tax=Euplotes crassus TaxID=5936 RepID=A0AAD1Y0A4_EUPCR|nr:unnamed protein product [Moneuplotes crassus]
MGCTFSQDSSGSPSKGMMKSSVDELIDTNPVMIFSKSYCPFCNKAKQLLSKLNVRYKSIELDQVREGTRMQSLLRAKSGQSTVPNIYINKQHIGGSDDLERKFHTKELHALLDQAGVSHS